MKECSTNIISENMLTQVDSKGYSLTMINSIIYYEPDESLAVPKLDRYVGTKLCQRCPIKLTQGWKLLIQFSDESKSWISIKDMKESNPVETADFSKAHNIDDELMFVWWVPYTLRKRDVIICKIKYRIRKTNRKYGV